MRIQAAGKNGTNGQVKPGEGEKDVCYVSSY